MNEALWYASRATGVASIVLLTAVSVLGVVTSGRRRPHGDQATIVMALHRWLSLGMAAFLTVHVGTAIAETYVSIDLISAIVPFTSEYARAWVGLGTLAIDILAAVIGTSWLRPRLPERTWKAVHWLSYLLWPAVLVHGFMLGTSDQPILRFVTVLCAAVGAGAIGWRATTSHHDRDRRRDVLVQEWS